jgi:MFS family permease
VGRWFTGLRWSASSSSNEREASSRIHKLKRLFSMSNPKPQLSLYARYQFLWDTARNTFKHLATGGEWAHSQTQETRQNLIWFWCDGLFSSVGDNVVATYLTVYLLALGATQAQIGLMSSISSLGAAMMLLPGAMLVERIGKRRGIVLIGGSWVRIALLLLALAPFFMQGNTLILIAMAISISRDAMGNLSFPAWMSITGDIVPLEGRGRFFASRNFIVSIAGMVTTFLFGLLIPRLAGTLGYQIAFGISFLLGVMALYSFGHINAKPLPVVRRAPSAGPRSSFLDELGEILTHREFAQFAAVTALWNIGLNFAGPFFNVYLVKNLGANATLVGITAIASSISGMLIQTRLGALHDRWGARKLTMISGLLIPILPLCWTFINSPWYVIPINLLGGALWGAYGMGSFNYLLQIVPSNRLARFSAIFQVVVTISLSIGAALGSLAINYWGFHGVFAGSFIGRLTAALLFVLLSSRRKPHQNKQ